MSKRKPLVSYAAHVDPQRGALTKHGLRPEDSISAYDHTTAGQDVFVGSLCVVAVMLLSYMSGQAKSADFIVSSIAGIALLGVVFFPTNRGEEDLRRADPRLCGPHTLPEPVSCSPTESTFGESTVATIHSICASIFILGLAVLAFVSATAPTTATAPPGGAASSAGP